MTPAAPKRTIMPYLNFVPFCSTLCRALAKPTFLTCLANSFNVAQSALARSVFVPPIFFQAWYALCNQQPLRGV